MRRTRPSALSCGGLWPGLALPALTLLVHACGQDACEPPRTDTLGELQAWEKDFIANGGTPEAPPPSFVDAEDGLKLAVHDWVPDDWSEDGALVLLIPGSSAYAELYAVLGEELAKAGVRARIIDVRGHGRSTCADPSIAGEDCGAPPEGGYPYADDGRYWVGKPGDSLDANQIIRDLGRHVAALRESFPQARLVLAGHSSGGGVVSRYVEHGGLSTVDAVALIAPFNHADQPQNNDQSERLCPDQAGSPYAQLDLGALGDALRGNTHRYVLDLVKDEAYQAPLDTQRYTYTTMLGMATTDAEGFLQAFATPTLWIAGRADALFDLERSRAQLDAMPGGGPFVEVLDTSHIGLTWSPNVARELARWALAPETVNSAVIEPE